MDKKQAILITLLVVGVSVGGYIYYRNRTGMNSNQIIGKNGEVLYQSTTATAGATTVAVPYELKDNAGIVNNNPLNIKKTLDSVKNPWVGQTGFNGRFVVFSSPLYGFRAAARILKTYGTKGYNTIQKIVEHWAPYSDGNNVAQYVKTVSQVSGIAPNAIVGKEAFAKVLQGMGKMETGKLYPIADIQAGVNLS